MRKLEVRVEFDGDPLTVGTLAERERRILFEYAPGFLRSGLQLSPIHLPLRPGVHEGPPTPFAGLPGVLGDSLPDGWGLLLMDRAFRQRGVSREAITPLDRLAFLGTRAMGALTYHPATGPEDGFDAAVELDEMAEQAERLLEGSAEDVLPELLRAGGSPGGARPKVVVGFREGDGALVSGAGPLPPGFRAFLVKFEARADPADAGAVELAYSRMAAAAGIRIPRARLFSTPGGGRYFAAERFDRPDGGRRHVHTLAGLLHADFRLPSLDYEAYLRATLHLTRDLAEVEEAFRRMVFNVLACNRDDHARNFAFRMEPDGTWHHTPAYDLTFSSGPGGEHTMSVVGEGRAPGRRHFSELAAKMSIEPRARDAVIEQVDAAVARWPAFAADTGVNDALVADVARRLTQIRSAALPRPR
ncbi:MAG TPA: type II toxin-antitoxin system HipA family toxin [Longimicrobium sp.]|jgi:serine/threonine-protein kinase HipA|nr:type II toxin-antitoxin system HipA family toxin [Longimicrobium sp.]